MPRKTPAYRAPFDDRGNLMHYPSDQTDWTGAGRQDDGTYIPPRIYPPDWRDNKPFQATLRLDGTRRGRSAAYFMWHDTEGHTYPMFISDLDALIQSGAVIAGNCIAGLWMVSKRGKNFGIRAATADEIPTEDPA